MEKERKGEGLLFKMVALDDKGTLDGRFSATSLAPTKCFSSVARKFGSSSSSKKKSLVLKIMKFL